MNCYICFGNWSKHSIQYHAIAIPFILGNWSTIISLCWIHRPSYIFVHASRWRKRNMANNIYTDGWSSSRQKEYRGYTHQKHGSLTIKSVHLFCYLCSFRSDDTFGPFREDRTDAWWYSTVTSRWSHAAILAKHIEYRNFNQRITSSMAITIISV